MAGRLRPRLQCLARCVAAPRLASSNAVPKTKREFTAASATAPASAASRETRKLQVNGRAMHVVVTGDLKTGVPVICLPGAMGTAETDFSYQFDGLSAAHGVVSFDPRGYGESRPPAREYPADFYHIDADDAAVIMEALGVKSYNVIGWSDGAISGTILASKYPAQVSKLVVFGIQAYISKDDVDTYESMRDVEKAWSSRMLAAHRAVYGEDVERMWNAFCDAMRMIHESGGDFCQKEAKLVKCPTFVLHGAKDPLVPAHHPEWICENIPGSNLHIFPDGKHNIHQKYADEFNRLVLRFLAE